MKRTLSALIMLSLCAAVLCSVPVRTVPPLIRLHVLAASDSAQDQAQKLAVRDAVLSAAQNMLQECTDYTQAYSILSERLCEIESAAASAAEGAPVCAALGTEEYPDRDYGAFSLPKGEYMSLRVGIGEAQGHNWWCVVYPSLCMPGNDAAEEIPPMLEPKPLRSVIWQWIRSAWAQIDAESGDMAHV